MTLQGFNRQSGKLFLQIAVLAIVYFALARFGLQFDAVSGFATLVWPPTGISLAALFLFGRRLWPGVLLGALAANYVTGAPVLVAFGIGIGNTLEALVGAYLLKHIGFNSNLERVHDVIGFSVLAAFVSTLVSATVGVSSLWLGGVIGIESYFFTWRAWWIGDMLGDLVIAALIFTWFSRWGLKITFGRVLELGSVALFLVLINTLVFGRLFSAGPLQPLSHLSLTYLIFPPLLWSAYRFGQKGAITTIFLTSVVAILYSLQERDLLTGVSTLSQSLLYLQLYMAIVAVTIMTLGAALTERRKILDEFTILSEEQAAKLEEVNKLNADLHLRTDELGRLNKAMVDRELKMIELKNEIKSLQAKSDKS